MTQALQRDINHIVSQLVTHYKPEKIILFGSAARGEAHDDSDLDLFLVKQTDKPFFDRAAFARRLFHSQWPVDLVVYTPKELRQAQEERRLFIRHVLQYGKVLYEQTVQPS